MKLASHNLQDRGQGELQKTDSENMSTENCLLVAPAISAVLKSFNRDHTDILPSSAERRE